MRLSVSVALLITVWHVGTEPASAIAGDGSDPREPLSFGNAALYCGWNDYLVREDTPSTSYWCKGMVPTRAETIAPGTSGSRKRGRTRNSFVSPLPDGEMPCLRSG